MRANQFGLAALVAVTSAAVAIGAAPIAVADECDPMATVCQGPDGQVATDSSPMSFAPSPALFPDNGGAPGEMQLTGENDVGGPGGDGGMGHDGGGHGR